MIKTIIRENAYYDSVTLMLISREIKKLDGVEEVLVGMGTDLNLDLVKMLDMFVPELEQVTPNDLFIAARVDEAKVTMEDLAASFEEQLNRKREAMRGTTSRRHSAPPSTTCRAPIWCRSRFPAGTRRRKRKTPCSRDSMSCSFPTT